MSYNNTIKDFNAIFSNLENQLKRDEVLLNLTANENILSNTANRFMNSIWASRYHLGTLRDYGESDFVNKGGLCFRGLSNIYKLEKYAKDCLIERTNAIDCEMRYLSGVHAVVTNINILTKPNDLILSICPSEGGHFATKNIVEYCGRKHDFLKFDIADSTIDIDHLRNLTKKSPPKVILFDHGATLFPLNISEVRSVLSDETLMIYDASHVLGLIIGNCFPNPLQQGCDILQGNTHKSFPGPQKALSFWKSSEHNKIIDGLDHAFVSSQHTHHSIALYISSLEMYCFGEAYTKKMLDNTQFFCEFLDQKGVPLFTTTKGWTNTNVFMIECNSMDEASQYCKNLNSIGISTNARRIYDKPCIRIGTQEITRKGVGKEILEEISDIFALIWKTPDETPKQKNRIDEITSSMKNILFSFDHIMC